MTTKITGGGITFQDTTDQNTAFVENFLDYGGTANDIVLTSSTELPPMRDGQRMRFRATATNTGAVTINGQATVTPTGVALPADFIRTDVTTEAEWDSGNNRYIVTPPNYWVVGGAGQTWQDVLASRSLDVTYTNTTGRPIMVNVTIVAQVGNGNANIYVDGLIASSSSTTQGGAVTVRTTMSAIVPSGSTYKSEGGLALSNWTELR